MDGLMETHPGLLLDNIHHGVNEHSVMGRWIEKVVSSENVSLADLARVSPYIQFYKQNDLYFKKLNHLYQKSFSKI